MDALSPTPFAASLATSGSQQAAPSTNALTTNGPSAAKADQVAKDFTSFVVSQFMQEMYADMKSDGTFGGGAGEDMFRGLLVDQYGKIAAQDGGFGLTDTVKRNILKLQEIKK